MKILTVFLIFFMYACLPFDGMKRDLDQASKDLDEISKSLGDIRESLECSNYKLEDLDQSIYRYSAFLTELNIINGKVKIYYGKIYINNELPKRTKILILNYLYRKGSDDTPYHNWICFDYSRPSIINPSVLDFLGIDLTKCKELE